MQEEIDMICTMTNTEMKLIVSSLQFKIEDKLDNDLDTIKDLQNLAKKINIMIERQTPYAWTYKWSRNILFLRCGSYYCNTLYTMGEQ